MEITYRRGMILLLVLLLMPSIGNNIQAQIPGKQSEQYKNAVNLYSKGMYQAAEKEFEQLLENSELSKSAELSMIESYLTLISIELSSPDIDFRVQQIKSKYPESPKMNEIDLKYGSHYFNLSNFSEAYKIFSTINPRTLPASQKAEFHFKLGYANLRIGNNPEALSNFAIITRLPFGSYSNPATYYSAHIEYMKRDFKKAIELFSKIEKDPRFTLLAKYYILESKFMLKDYAFVVQNGEILYQQLTGELRTKSARVVSESFFALGNTEKAQFYFDRYSAESGTLTRKDIYYAGIIAYTQKRYDQAIEILKQVIGEDDSLSQNASYHLGRCYIEIKNKVEALNSFRLASEGMHDLTIKEDAMFNFAKLSFDLNSDIGVFRRYLDTYSPTEQKFNEIQNYIATSYLLKQDYRSAIDILRTIRNPSSKDIINLQKATFLRGMQLVNLGAYREAIPVFELSTANGNYNNNLLNVTQFWLAEAYYRDNRFQRSVDINLALATRNSTFKGNREYSTSLYNLAYSYFKLANFEQAETWFKRYLNLPTGEILYADEAVTRLGDCLFMQRKYTESITAFSGVSNSKPALKQYASYQMAIAHGLLGDDTRKTSLLKELVSLNLSPHLYPEVLYELGRTLVQKGLYSDATGYFNELKDKFGTTPFYPKALLELGLIALNRGESNNAADFYKKILQETPQSPEASAAIAGLENIYQDQGRAEEFLAFLDGLGLSKVRTTDERELIIFSSAEKHFLSGNYAQAVSSLNSFIKSYPTGTKAAQAYFYLGESYQKTGKPELALDAFLKVMEIGEGSFTELATLNYARISYQIENYRQANKAYSTLSRIAQLENNKVEAQIGKTNSFYMDKQYENAIAEGIRSESLNITDQERTRVKFVIAKSYWMLGERSKAIPYLNDLAKNKINPEGAESTYLLISDAFDKGEFQKVERDVYSFSESRTPQSYWLAKSFILLGDSFAERENWDQAEATYKSILESYKPQGKDDIEEQLKMRLNKLSEKK
ncbi:MAG: tetratricopeptide repeat protein [Bacteroidales bacterium]|nr:tetratricopeptide repeat protein [Bacteroidales bacterium]